MTFLARLCGWPVLLFQWEGKHNIYPIISVPFFRQCDWYRPGCRYCTFSHTIVNTGSPPLRVRTTVYNRHNAKPILVQLSYDVSWHFFNSLFGWEAIYVSLDVRQGKCISLCAKRILSTATTKGSVKLSMELCSSSKPQRCCWVIRANNKNPKKPLVVTPHSHFLQQRTAPQWINVVYWVGMEHHKLRCKLTPQREAPF